MPRSAGLANVGGKRDVCELASVWLNLRDLVIPAEKAEKQGYGVVWGWNVGTAFISDDERSPSTKDVAKECLLVLPPTWTDDGSIQQRCSGRLH